MEDLYQKIRYLRDVQKLTFRQIQQETGINRKTCSRIYSGAWQPPKQRGSCLDKYQDLIAHWFKEHPTLKAIQIYERLKTRGLVVSHARVAQYTRTLRKKKSKVFWSLDFLAGEEGQVDWFFVNHPILGKLCGFALILSYSRYLFAHLFCRHSFEFFCQGHIMALAAFGGCPRALRYDNLKSVVLKREPLTYNPAFLDFARHYGFEIRLCNPASGNEKGRVERVIRSLRETFFNTAEHHTNLRALNTALHEWVHNKNNTVHRTTEKTPMFLKEQENLKPLPGSPWLNAVVHPPTKPSKTGLVTFDTNRYSVPDYLVDQLLCVRSYPDRIDIHDLKGHQVASHPRSFTRNQSFLNPSHRSFAQLSDNAKRQRIFYVIKNLNPLTESFLEQNRATGEDPYASAYCLFKLLKLHGRETILSALREALSRKSPRTKFIMSLLSPHNYLPKEQVQPQDQKLLQLDYQPRPLEDYSHEQ